MVIESKERALMINTGRYIHWCILSFRIHDHALAIYGYIYNQFKFFFLFSDRSSPIDMETKMTKSKLRRIQIGVFWCWCYMLFFFSIHSFIHLTEMVFCCYLFFSLVNVGKFLWRQQVCCGRQTNCRDNEEEKNYLPNF